MGRARWLLYVKRFGRKWAGPLVENGVIPPPGTFVTGGRLQIPAMGYALDDPTPATMAWLRTLENAIDISSRGGSSVKFLEDGIEIDMEALGVKVFAPDTVDVNVIHEVFVERLYMFEAPGPFLVLDMGMNIGSASLFFARFYDADVHAFELVPSTTKIAERNIALNPGLAKRITIHECGLSNRDQQISLEASPLHRAGNSLHPPHEFVDPDKRRETVQVKDVAAVFDQILPSLGERKLVVKMDVEGEEYAIVDRLAERNLLGSIAILFLEWHHPDLYLLPKLKGQLRDAGFRWFEREHPHYAHIGMITAYRQ